MFLPVCCPYSACPSHASNTFDYHRKGSFTRAIDHKVVQRYACKTCKRSFSDQTFRLDFRLRRPWLNTPIFWALSSKVTHRQTARQLKCSRATVEHRVDLFGRHCQAFHELQRRRLKGTLVPDFALDELETYETDRRLKPVTVPVLIHETSWFVLDVQVAPMAARGGLAPRFEQKKQIQAGLYGKRKSGSTEAVRKCLESAKDLVRPEAAGFLRTDQKKTYVGLKKKVLPKEIVHLQVSSEMPRDMNNPLFRINRTLAMMRDGVSRLVRRTWAAAKKRERLEKHLWVWIAFRNYVRRMINRSKDISAASSIGLFRGPLGLDDLLGLRPQFRRDPPGLCTAG
jgi:transposase-like protein